MCCKSYGFLGQTVKRDFLLTGFCPLIKNVQTIRLNFMILNNES